MEAYSEQKDMFSLMFELLFFHNKGEWQLGLSSAKNHKYHQVANEMFSFVF